MQIVPTSLVRISRYYMVTALAYLLLTLFIGVFRVLEPIPSSMFHWVPALFGWVTFPIMGAFYQFFPTLQGRDLKWENLTIPQFALMNAGVIGLMIAAWTGNRPALLASSTIYIAGALLFAAIIVLANLELSKLTLTLRFYLASLTYFIVAVLLFYANVLGAGLSLVTLPLLMHLMAFGFGVTAIMGAEYSMVPMLQLKELRYPQLADVQFVLITLGFWGLAASFVIGGLAVTAAAGILATAGILLFAFIIVASLRHGPSRLPRLDISVKYFLVGIAYLIATAIVGILMAAFGWFTLIPIHVHLGLIGVITVTIMGAMYHVVPFVVWWEVYAPRLGYEDVPLLKQLYSHRIAEWQLYGVNAGLLLMIAGFATGLNYLLASGGTLIIISAIAFAWQMIGVVGHRRNLKKPLPQQATEKTLRSTI